MMNFSKNKSKKVAHSSSVSQTLVQKMMFLCLNYLK